VDIVNRLELVEKLKAAGVRSTAYSVDGNKDMALCIEKKGDQWDVFYSERGGESFSKTFYSEKAACEFMFDSLMNDKTSFIKI